MTRNITNKDFDFIYQLYMHPLVNPYLLYELMPPEAFKPIFDDLLYKNEVYIFSDKNVSVGMFKLISLQHRSSHINYLGGLAIHPDFAGKGYGKKMFSAILKIGQSRNLKRIELSVATTNINAIKLYEKMGFEAEGILKKYTYLKAENKYIDELYMAYLF